MFALTETLISCIKGYKTGSSISMEKFELFIVRWHSSFFVCIKYFKQILTLQILFVNKYLSLIFLNNYLVRKKH